MRNSGYYDPRTAATANSLQRSDNAAAWQQRQLMLRSAPNQPTVVNAPEVAGATVGAQSFANPGNSLSTGAPLTNPWTGAPAAGAPGPSGPPLSLSHPMQAPRMTPK